MELRDLNKVEIVTSDCFSDSVCCYFWADFSVSKTKNCLSPFLNFTSIIRLKNCLLLKYPFGFLVLFAWNDGSLFLFLVSSITLNLSHLSNIGGYVCLLCK